MIAPDLSFQTAIRTQLVHSAPLSLFVPETSIRAGYTRPDRFPCILLASPQTINLGRASGGYYLTRVFLDLHVWAIDDGADTAQKIGGVVAQALWDAPDLHDVIHLPEEYERPSFRFMRDPDPEKAYCHGVGTVSGVVQWKV